MKQLLALLFSLSLLTATAFPARAQVGRESTNFSQWKLATNAADFLTRMGATNLLRLLTNDASALTNLVLSDTNAGNLMIRSNNLSDISDAPRARTNLGVQRIVAGTNLVAQTNGVNVTVDLRAGAAPLLSTAVVSNWINIPVGVSNLHPVRVDQLASNTNAIVALLFSVNAGDSNAWRAADTAISNAIATLSNLFRAGDTAISNNFWVSNVAIISQILTVSNQMRAADTALSNSVTSASNNLQTQINGLTVGSAIPPTNQAGGGILVTTNNAHDHTFTADTNTLATRGFMEFQISNTSNGVISIIGSTSNALLAQTVRSLNGNATNLNAVQRFTLTNSAGQNASFWINGSLVMTNGGFTNLAFLSTASLRLATTTTNGHALYVDSAGLIYANPAASGGGGGNTFSAQFNTNGGAVTIASGALLTNLALFDTNYVYKLTIEGDGVEGGLFLGSPTAWTRVVMQGSNGIAGVFNRSPSTDSFYFGESSDEGGFYFRGLTAASFEGGITPQTFDTTTLPTQATGTIIFVSDGDGGSPCLAVFDGTDWRRITLGTAVSNP